MAWTSPRTWVALETVTAALLNTHVRDNLNALMVVTTKGDIAVATASVTLTRLAVGADGDVLVSDSAATPGVRWSSTAKTAAAASLVMVNLAGTMTAAANNDTLRNLRVRGVVGSGTLTGLTLNLLELAGSLVTKTGTGTVDVARTVYIDAPTIGTINTPIYIASGVVGIGDDRNANMTTGLTINQDAADNEILALKSSDVAHGLTGITETDTFGLLKKFSGANGGLNISGLSEVTTGVEIYGLGVTADTTKATTSNGAVNLRSNFTSATANANIACIQTDGVVTRFIFDVEGEAHEDVGTAFTNFDEHDDFALLNLLAAKITRRDDPIRRSFGKWLRENRKILEELKLVTFNRDGHHFINRSRVQNLLIGAMRQAGAKLDAQAARLLQLEQKVLQLSA